MIVSRSRWWLAAVVIAALALAASANSVVNGFTYDDIYTIVRDPRAHTLSGWWTEFTGTYWSARWGGDGYRPMTRIMFRLAWAIGDGSPMPFHAMNIVVHLSGSIAVFWLACALLPFAAAWIAAALYAVHPVHTEAIANSVGSAELFVLLLFVLATALYIHGRRAGPITWRRWVAIGTLYVFACFFKEHAIVLPAVLIFAELLVIPDRLSARQRVNNLRLPILSLSLIAVAFLWARTNAVAGVSGFIPAIPFQTLNLTTGNRVLTMVGAAPEWYRLLLWPQRLMSDYTPPYIDMAEGPSLLHLPGALLLLGTLGLAIAWWRRSPVTSFGITWIAITLLPVSNLLVPSGILLAERTLMLPSVGAMIAICSVIPWLYTRVEHLHVARIATAGAVVVLLVLGIVRSVDRNRVWLNNETLFRQGVIDAPTSYRTHWLLGNHLRLTKRTDEGLRHLEQAFRLFPYDPILPYVVADGLRLRGNCEPAVKLYRWAFELAPALRHQQLGLSICLLHMLRLDEAKAAALEALRYGAKYDQAVEVIRAIDAGQDSIEVRRAQGDSAVLAGQSP
jgi:hypothetical protein